MSTDNSDIAKILTDLAELEQKYKNDLHGEVIKNESVKFPGTSIQEDVVKTVKAFHNWAFLSTNETRPLRILCEFEETRVRLRDFGVFGTVLFFGSARSMYEEEMDKRVADLEEKLQKARASGDQAMVDKEALEIQRLESCRWMCKYCNIAESLSRRITEWTMKSEIRRKLYVSSCEERSYINEGRKLVISASGDYPQSYVVSSGGGPGLMEAVNKGATSVKDAKSLGMAVSLPFRKGLNKHVTPELAFEYHYFFTRKFWMMYPAKAIIASPGGFGTFDELFEFLTLRQCGKCSKTAPIVLLGEEYWRGAVNWQFLADKGVISQDDIDSIFITDSAEQAFQYITTRIEPGVIFQTPATPDSKSAYNLLVLSGPVGIGKREIASQLVLLRPDLFVRAKGHTTRENRGYEEDYYFVTKDEFHRIKENNGFVEIDHINGHEYGVSKEEINRILSFQKIGILLLDYEGAVRIKKELKHLNDVKAYYIFLEPRSTTELRKVIENRPGMTEAEVDAYMEHAFKEVNAAARNRVDGIRVYNKVITNVDLEDTLQKVLSTVLSLPQN